MPTVVVEILLVVSIIFLCYSVFGNDMTRKRYDYPCIEGVKTAYKHRQTSTADEHGQTGNGMATEGQMPCWAISMFKNGHKRAGTFPNTQDYALLCKKE